MIQAMSDDKKQESFEEFKNSFSYGTRTDLNFKFLKALSDEEASCFFQELLWQLGDSFNDGQIDRLVEHVQRWQKRAYDGAGQWQYDDGPFAPLPKPLSELKLALMTSTGHFMTGDDPEPFGVKNMGQREATERIDDFLKTEPQLSTVPIDTEKDNLQVRHGGYDIRGVQCDPNVAFPLDILRNLAQEGVIGEVAQQAYSFVGACSQMRLLKRTGPEWVKLFQEQQIDAALLIPV